MKLSESFFITRREFPKDEDTISSKLLIKSGIILKNDSGIYTYLPIGLKVLENIKNVINDEMKRIGANEVLMPSLINSDFYVRSNRHEYLGSEMFDIESKNGKTYNLCPTHEELFAYASKSMIRSYKDMPFNLYQIQTKFRDEPRARFGLIRVKEFVMKDAYSFDRDEAGLDVSYKKMFDAYKDIFDEIGLDYRIVKADTGIMGGLLSEEFQAIAPIGEDSVIYCDCGYSSNEEVAELVSTLSTEEEKEIEEVATPHAKTIEEVCEYLHVDPSKSVKANSSFNSGSIFFLIS